MTFNLCLPIFLAILHFNSNIKKKHNDLVLYSDYQA